MNFELKRKKFYPVDEPLFDYLDRFKRCYEFPLAYEEMHRFSKLYPLYDRDGTDTLWKTVFYEPAIQRDLGEKLVQIYALLKTNEDSMGDHLALDRVDFCEFGNSRPFRIRIVNRFNDNYDHFYVKLADASRIHGLELEHILSPNRINYLVQSSTLIEEHIAGVPGDIFIRDYTDRPETNRVRVAKEFVKFSERSFIRLLGDMRSYNYVVDITPDFEDAQYRVRAIDFDQQSYEGHKKMYLPQFFVENQQVVELCTDRINYRTMQQYQHEERTLIARRCQLAQVRLDAFWEATKEAEVAPQDHVTQLQQELNRYHDTDAFSAGETMPQLVRINLEVTLSKPQA
ncbi:MAG: hypothetical protein AAF236_06420 [Verrucomicrobiota bacterium]